MNIKFLLLEIFLILVLNYKSNLIFIYFLGVCKFNLFQSELMLQIGVYTKAEFLLIAKKTLITLFWLLDIVILIGSLKILGDKLGENKDVIDKFIK